MSALKQTIKRFIGPHGNPLLPVRSMAHLEAIRTFELGRVVRHVSPASEVLEIGAGTGWQARRLSELGFRVTAVDVQSSNYAVDRVWPVLDYDGSHLPFADSSFDCIFTSNTLEHIREVRSFQGEMRRVLRSGGIALHLIPSASWRLWTNLTNPLRYLSPPLRHGEHAANAFSEVLYFQRRWWRRLFLSTGWTIVYEGGNDLFYTGCSIADSHLTIRRRHELSKVLGSACHVFVLSKASSRPPAAPSES
jgi:SAM-dependent methyltransferase